MAYNHEITTLLGSMPFRQRKTKYATYVLENLRGTVRKISMNESIALLNGNENNMAKVKGFFN